MADDDDKKSASIPDWQKTSQETLPFPTNGKTSSPNAELDLVEQARLFLTEKSIKDASRERKIAFLEKKGLESDIIQKLLGSDPESILDIADAELKTVHDSNASTASTKSSPPSVPTKQEQTPTAAPATVAVRSESPPIITYPEFLLKPQKPPPLVTIERLVNAAYALAGLSAVTYGASKYLIQPMLESLTEARHDLVEGAKQDLYKLNTKLESSVSHVPYIASSTVLKRQEHDADHSDTDSLDSDPTELFHRDIATQTTPKRSRSSSRSSTIILTLFDPTAQQTSRLASLHTTLQSLLSSTNTTFSQSRLKDSLSDFQSVVDSLESNHSPLSSGYTLNDKSKTKNSTPASDAEAVKFKAEIRALKGAFLSSRNFPTIRPAMPFTLPAR